MSVRFISDEKISGRLFEQHITFSVYADVNGSLWRWCCERVECLYVTLRQRQVLFPRARWRRCWSWREVVFILSFLNNTEVWTTFYCLEVLARLREVDLLRRRDVWLGVLSVTSWQFSSSWHACCPEVLVQKCEKKLDDAPYFSGLALCDFGCSQNWRIYWWVTKFWKVADFQWFATTVFKSVNTDWLVYCCARRLLSEWQKR
jgi:hypothetical protein